MTLDSIGLEPEPAALYYSRWPGRHALVSERVDGLSRHHVFTARRHGRRTWQESSAVREQPSWYSRPGSLHRRVSMDGRRGWETVGRRMSSRPSWSAGRKVWSVCASIRRSARSWLMSTCMSTWAPLVVVSLSANSMPCSPYSSAVPVRSLSSL